MLAKTGTRGFYIFAFGGIVARSKLVSVHCSLSPKSSDLRSLMVSICAAQRPTFVHPEPLHGDELGYIHNAQSTVWKPLRSIKRIPILKCPHCPQALTSLQSKIGTHQGLGPSMHLVK